MDLKELKFGTEIETIKRTRQRVAEAIRTIVGGTVRHVGHPTCYDPWEVAAADGRVWKVVADSSLTSVASHLRAEVVSPALTYADIPELRTSSAGSSAASRGPESRLPREQAPCINSWRGGAVRSRSGAPRRGWAGRGSRLLSCR